MFQRKGGAAIRMQELPGIFCAVVRLDRAQPLAERLRPLVTAGDHLVSALVDITVLSIQADGGQPLGERPGILINRLDGPPARGVQKTVLSVQAGREKPLGKAESFPIKDPVPIPEKQFGFQAGGVHRNTGGNNLALRVQKI